MTGWHQEPTSVVTRLGSSNRRLMGTFLLLPKKLARLPAASRSCPSPCIDLEWQRTAPAGGWPCQVSQPGPHSNRLLRLSQALSVRGHQTRVDARILRGVPPAEGFVQDACAVRIDRLETFWSAKFCPVARLIVIRGNPSVNGDLFAVPLLPSVAASSNASWLDVRRLCRLVSLCALPCRSSRIYSPDC